MFSWKPVVRFIAVFLSCYILLIVVGSFFQRQSDNHFRSFGKFFFSDFKKKGMVWFEPVKNPEEKHFTTKIRLINKDMYAASQKNKNPLKTGAVTASAWYTGYLPIILVLSLIIATPLTLKRKGVALLWGMLLVHGFIWLQLYIQILHEFNHNEFLNVVHFSSSSQKMMDALHYLLVESMGTTFIIPVFIWLIATFRKGDLETILQK